MHLEEAIQLIRSAVPEHESTWADIGAGTGLFTLALAECLKSGVIIALDKNPHALWSLSVPKSVRLEIVEADFTQTLALPPLDGMIVANALHYAQETQQVFERLMDAIRPGGTCILIEYETQTPLDPWIPYPVSFAKFEALCEIAGFASPALIGKAASNYGHDHIYSARVTRT